MQGPATATAGTPIAYSDFLTKVDEGQIKSVEIRGPELVGKLASDEDFRTYNPGDNQLIQRLRDKGVRFDAKPEESRSLLAQLFFSMLPFILMIGIWLFVMRNMQNGAGRGAMGFGNSRAKLLVQIGGSASPSTTSQASTKRARNCRKSSNSSARPAEVQPAGRQDP